MGAGGGGGVAATRLAATERICASRAEEPALLGRLVTDRGPFYWLAPESIVHSWAEVLVGEQWVGLEGVILDLPYLNGVRASFAASGGAFLGYGVGTEDIARPENEWRGEDTFIQKSGVNRDLSVFDDPDSFYAAHGVNLRGVRAWLFRAVIRGRMNAKVEEIRTGS